MPKIISKFHTTAHLPTSKEDRRRGIYSNACGHQRVECSNDVLHTMDSYVVKFCTGGGGLIQSAGETIEFCAGDVIALRPDVPYVNSPADGGFFETFWVHCHGDIVKRLFNILRIRSVSVIKLGRGENTEDCFRRIFALMREDNPFCNLRVSQILYGMFLEIEMEVIASRDVDRSLLELLEKNPGSVEEMAKLAHVSKHHFIRWFKKKMGTTPGRYLIERRLAKAQEMLKNGDLYVSEVADVLGMDPNYFARFFKKHTGKTPQQYRKDNASPTFYNIKDE